MELYLQFGYGMMEHTRHLLRTWDGGTVILSPRDLDCAQIASLSSDVHRLNGNVWVDPQLYLPRSDHHRLTQHEYWPSDYTTALLAGGSAMDSLIERLRVLNDQANADVFLIPGLYAGQITDDWCVAHGNLVETSARICEGYRRFATVCISGNSLRNEDEVEVLLNECENWDVDGFYVVPEHPAEDYLVTDPLWLSNLMLLVSGLRLLEKQVVVGYCSHQMLILTAAKANAIGSGTWLNVRSFSLSKFQNPDEDEASRRTIWYYCPQALTEYKIPFLDMAHVGGILNEMRPDSNLGSNYADALFSGAQPTSTAYGERESFRHYLQALHHQVAISARASYRETVESQRNSLENARSLLARLSSRGVRGAQRDFSDIIDVNMAAIDRLDNERGFVLERTW